MNLFSYFDLGFTQSVLKLGKKTRKEEQRESRRGMLITLLMYACVWLGVLGQKVMELWQAKQEISLENMGSGYLLVALVIATVIFPVVFPKVFAKAAQHPKQSEASAWFVAQLCVAFQQGFFWQSLLSLIAPK